MLNLDQFMNIRFLHRQGHSVREIARLTGCLLYTSLSRALRGGRTMSVNYEQLAADGLEQIGAKDVYKRQRRN